MNIDDKTHLLNLAKNTKHRKRGTASLKLTSMIDMFTILLVFLLHRYSAEGQIMTLTKDLSLPESTSQLQPKVTSIISITREWVLVDGRPIERIENILAEDKLIIAPLHTELTKIKSITQGISTISDQMGGFKGNITIQGNEDITFNLLKKVMLTCGTTGYNNMLLAVAQIE
ncbi:MAG TPA: biopolymer transporter ExbD [bacterium]|nr:biopolymer transporter ExbD [bacterium]HPN44861.1 biopolymer transporter ExbD [bacterium]